MRVHREGGTTGETVRVALVEDNARYRQSIELLMAHAPGFTLARSVTRAETLIADLESGGARWDLVLMDLELPGISGIEATRRLKAINPALSVVVLTVFEEPATILDAIAAGVDGYLLKKTTAPEMLAQLRSILDGGAPLTSGVARTLLDLVRAQQRGAAGVGPEGVGRLDLSEREQEVLRGLVRGLSYKQVADQCDLSLDTVRTHVRNIYRKLRVHSVAQAVSRAIRERLV
jgi:DNA-binding NarL/FixJ family response regulator